MTKWRALLARNDTHKLRLNVICQCKFTHSINFGYEFDKAQDF